MPRRERRSAGARVTSSPRKETRPEVARNSPERRLSSVDFPAPLGPMTACTRPRSNESETRSTAASAPKRRVSCSVRSSASAIRAPHRLEQAGHTAREEEDDGDHQHCHERAPVVGEPLAVVLEEGEQERAQRRTVERPLASEEHGDAEECRLPPAEERGGDEAIECRVEVAG